jgi:integrase
MASIRLYVPDSAGDGRDGPRLRRGPAARDRRGGAGRRPALRDGPADARRLERFLVPASVRQARAVLSASMRWAVEDGRLVVSPVSAVRPPKARRPELVIPDATQLSALLEAARGSTYEVPLVLAVATGMRRSEVLGVRWADVDLDRRTIRVERGLQRVARGDGTRDLRPVEPKSSRSRREVRLPAFAVARLRQHRKDQAERSLALGSGWFRDEALGELVCDRGDGGPIDPDNLTKAFFRHAKAAGLDPRTRLHDVRHAVATRLAQDGVPLVAVSALLGHSSASFTATTYQHWTEALAGQTADAIDRAFGAGS